MHGDRNQAASATPVALSQSALNKTCSKIQHLREGFITRQECQVSQSSMRSILTLQGSGS